MKIKMLFFAALAVLLMMWFTARKPQMVPQQVASIPVPNKILPDLPEPPEVRALVEEPVKEPVRTRASASHDYNYYRNGYDVLNEYVQREGVVERLNKNQVSDAQRDYFLKILEKLSWYKLRAVDLRLKEIEKELGS
jgi:hypothetical protein